MNPVGIVPSFESVNVAVPFAEDAGPRPGRFG